MFPCALSTAPSGNTRNSTSADTAHTRGDPLPGYIDAFVLAVPKKKLAAYKRVSQRFGKIWREHGALDYNECLGDDLKHAKVLPFPRLTRLKRGEVVVFSWILFRSRAHRDRVNARGMRDPRTAKLMSMCMVMDPKRMAYGGFKVMVKV